VGTNIIIEAAGLNENIRVKYICDVDDTRGGRAVAEVKKIQGFKRLPPGICARYLMTRRSTGNSGHTGTLARLATVWGCQAGKDVYVESVSRIPSMRARK